MRTKIFLLLLSLCALSLSQWNKISFPTTEYLWKVGFATEQTGWIAGQTFIYRTTNGGQTWTPQDSSHGAVFAMKVINESTMVFNDNTHYLYPDRGTRRTTDGGITWKTVDSSHFYFDDIELADATTLYMGGGTFYPNVTPAVRKSTDGGATWFGLPFTFPKGKVEFTGLSFVQKDSGWGVTYDGFVYKTTNGGTDWILLDSLGDNSYRDIDFLDKNYGWVVGGISGTQRLAYTTNGGTSWNHLSQSGSSIREVEVVDLRNVWFGGNNNFSPYVSHYDSIGSSWIDQNVPSPGVESIDMVNAKVGYSVGGAGYVFKTTNGGVVSVGPEQLNAVPAEFELVQNFPNPFNPTTTIRFSLPENGPVSLKIHSVTGQLIEELVRRTMDAGTYSVQWNAQQYPSGVYFYTLSAGVFTETKRLVMIK